MKAFLGGQDRVYLGFRFRSLGCSGLGSGVYGFRGVGFRDLTFSLKLTTARLPAAARALPATRGVLREEGLKK